MPIQTDTSVTPTARDPREFEYGLFITDAPAQGGAAGFSWFASDAEGLAYLAEQLPALYLDTDEIEEITSAITEALQRASELKALDLAPINAALTGLCEVRWAGTFYDLESGSKPFEREIQTDYRNNIFGDERGHTESDSDDFVTHLEHYNC